MIISGGKIYAVGTEVYSKILDLGTYLNDKIDNLASNPDTMSEKKTEIESYEIEDTYVAIIEAESNKFTSIDTISKEVTDLKFVYTKENNICTKGIIEFTLPAKTELTAVNVSLKNGNTEYPCKYNNKPETFKSNTTYQLEINNDCVRFTEYV